jgi:HlyD family secretion protein
MIAMSEFIKRRLFRGSAKGTPPGRLTVPEGEIFLEDILTERPSTLLGGGHYLIVGMFVSLIVVASVVKVDIIITAPGRLAADSPPIVVQPLTLSVIREIRVKAGDEVHTGDVLATLDPTFTEADSSTLAAQREALQYEIRRLEAELGNTPYIEGARTPEDVLQHNLYQQRQSQYTARLRGFDEDLARYQGVIKATEQNRASLDHQLAVAREVEVMRGSLFQKQVGSKLNYLDSQASRMHAERDSEDMGSRLAENRHYLQATEASRQVFMDEWHRQQLVDLSKARETLAGVSASLVKAQRLNDLVVLTAPTNGIVLEVARRSVGSVLNAAEALITIVPTDSPMIADVMINSADVGLAKPGDEVMIKVDAFPFTQHGLLKGRLRSIGEDSSSPNGAGADMSSVGQGSGVFHRSEVQLTDTALAGLAPGAHLFPGMSLSAEIKVGSRSVIAYFIDPILRGFHDSIREP